MIRLLRPGSGESDRFLESAGSRPVSYPEVGSTLGVLPAGYAVDRNRVDLGSGRDTWTRAVAALRAWRMFELGWVEIRPATPPIELHRTVAAVVRAMGVWFLNPCRIVAVVDEPRRFGFSYGTVDGHFERGEERFLVEWRPDDGVHYEILAFSRPGRLLSRLGKPFVRRLQRRFAADSKRAMARAVQEI